MIFRTSFAFAVSLIVTFGYAPSAVAQNTLSTNDKSMMYLTCINRKPLKPINSQAAMDCARNCRPNGKGSDQECLESYEAAMGQAYVPTGPAPTTPTQNNTGIRQQNSSSAR